MFFSGYGTAVLQPILSLADAQCKKCYLDLTDFTTLSFFKKAGFVEIAQVPTDSSLKNPPTLVLTREPNHK